MKDTVIDKAVKAEEPKQGLMRGLLSGVAHRIKILGVQGELPYWDLQLGDLPKIRVHCEVETVLPIEYISLLDGTGVDTFRHVALSFPDPDTGNIFRSVPHFHKRAPYQDYGEVPWSEWLAVWNKSKLVKA